MPTPAALNLCALGWTPGWCAHILLPSVGAGLVAGTSEGAQSLLSAGTKEPKDRRRWEANKSRVRPGRWATACTGRAGIPARPRGARSREALPRAKEWGSPLHPDVRSQGHRCGLPRAVLPARVVHPSALPPHGVCSNVASPGAHPCTLLGQSPPGLGVGQEEMKPKLSC